jgi:hypothetical protein
LCFCIRRRVRLRLASLVSARERRRRRRGDESFFFISSVCPDIDPCFVTKSHVFKGKKLARPTF